MAGMILPPGFRFHPTDVELIKYYLKGKVMGKKFRFEAISDLNIYKFSPWDLPDKSFLQSKDREWYFFCPRERKYASGVRTSRTTGNGFWKITCKDKPVLHNEQTVGSVKTLVFHQSHTPRAERTDWFMHEYRIEDKDLTEAGVIQDAYVLCRIFKKSDPGPKNGVEYGDRFSEEDWCDEVEDAPYPAAFVLPNYHNDSSVTSMSMLESNPTISVSEATVSVTDTGPSYAVPSAEEVPQPPPDDDDLDLLLASFTEDSTLLSVDDNNNVMPDDFGHGKSIEDVCSFDGNYITNSLANQNDWPEFSEGGFNFTTNQLAGSAAFLELDDLEYPLDCPAEASGSESLYVSSDHCNYEDPNCNPVNSAGSFQHVSRPEPLEGFNGPGVYFDVSQKENDIRENADQGCNSTWNNVDFIPCGQPEEGCNQPMQEQKRVRYR